MHFDFDVEHNDKDPKFKVHYRVIILKQKNIFAKCFTPYWSGEVFVIKKVKNTVPETNLINDFNGKNWLERFTKKNQFRVEKLILKS